MDYYGASGLRCLPTNYLTSKVLHNTAQRVQGAVRDGGNGVDVSREPLWSAQRELLPPRASKGLKSSDVATAEDNGSLIR